MLSVVADTWDGIRCGSDFQISRCVNAEPFLLRGQYIPKWALKLSNADQWPLVDEDGKRLRVSEATVRLASVYTDDSP